MSYEEVSSEVILCRYTCDRCKHVWVMTKDSAPRVCPNGWVQLMTNYTEHHICARCQSETINSIMALRIDKKVEP